ncbi:uncharacterized protein ASCRUDRAFT_75145 [Ascoidea rubescens DSM 1968]|uniref:Uncharacterized protein n=1 Tax=Ascoidea rubescens DSM 1968 TaxID=1344418 RepID=A0A1D2VJU3_9ASCO|nr:hypothetical protein ASCRUDRAFT_75145 [Ascoidea rubescens DSM 1968]ODV61882.1 hypothetical protein ASCRUDRAFT_75145 [Ascoidea rubescens DSM 1968]
MKHTKISGYLSCRRFINNLLSVFSQESAFELPATDMPRFGYIFCSIHSWMPYTFMPICSH